MPESIRELKKQGAKTREINTAIKAAMQLIMENREKKEKERLEDFQRLKEELKRGKI